ncbi:MAG: uracil-DNA glycosylase [Vallitaleaceae bacterium]|nr:uracil-DNA glycosylase [Vallitaleaceae bacterium]
MTESWKYSLEKEFDKPYYQNLLRFLDEEYENNNIFPPRNMLFTAFSYTPLEKVKVLILGQDPYHDENQAHGLAFSVLAGQKIPPSLMNIYKELAADLGCYIPNHGYLKKWADQGVLMLNAVLSVRAHQANSHKGKGWEIFTDEVIRIIDQQNQPIVIFLWGKPAQEKEKMLTNPKHLVIKTSHPSPLSAYKGFFGSKCFRQCNEFLMREGLEAIDWQIEN